MIVQRAIKSTDAYGSAEVVEACDGREALGTIERERPDVVLSDWNMPEMTGIELLVELGERGIDVPLGFVTSESTPEMYDRAVSHGARFMVTKPFTPEMLSDALGQL